ncbi:uncharacterized protein LOC130988468 [Salvia miltiorrhiza]|uniref:uncharacterized protein LOC130988468 n=1 Tax=Salvia miltiorrhiza TaxID=226208 RepID=UPI0025AC3648|nr:uncharacterized protein LOC130988468 [Salvia miltiorrhiza]
MMMMRAFFSYLFFLLFHFGCFTSSSHHHHHHHHPTKKRTLFSYLKRLFSSSSASHIPPPPPSIPSPSSSTRSLRLNPPLIAPLHDTDTARVDIHPCTVCGEIFQTPAFLHHHQSSKHGVSDLVDGENIVRIIFKTGWPAKTPAIHRILKIHNTPRVLARFEDHRERVRSAGTKSSRCAADGNELLRFYCTTFICSLDSAICNQQFCGACAIIRCGFSQKLDGIPTLPTGWKAHAAVPDDVEEEFGFMNVKRAMLVCRVIAGRVGTLSHDHEIDSLVGPADDELLVFSPRAILPCFVIVYTV